jgi:hypothetical protein
MGGDDLDVVVAAAPLVAWKLARLRRLDGVVRLAPLHDRGGAPGWYGVVSRARCDLGRRHEPPDVACTCGFHAVAGPAEAERIGGWLPDRVALDVVLGGVVVDHEHGWRAAQQRVVALSAPASCARCDGPTVAFAVGHRGMLRPVCDRHAARVPGRRRLAVERIAADLGIPVQLAARGGAPAADVARARRRAAIGPLATAVALVPLAAVTGEPVVATAGSSLLWLWPLSLGVRWRGESAERRRAAVQGTFVGTVVGAGAVGMLVTAIGWPLT